MGASAETQIHYSADTRVSQFTIQAFAAGIVAVVAHSPKIAIRDWSADMRFTPETFAHASVIVKGQIASFDVLDELRDDDRRLLQRVMMQEVLEADQYPEFLFESTAITSEKQRTDLYRMSIEGMLTLHGRKRHQAFTSRWRWAPTASGLTANSAFGKQITKSKSPQSQAARSSCKTS